MKNYILPRTSIARFISVCAILLVCLTIDSFAARWVRVGVISAPTNTCFWVLVEDNGTSTPTVLGFTQFDCASAPHRRVVCSNGLTVEQNIKKYLPNLSFDAIETQHSDKRIYTTKDCKIVFESKQSKPNQR